MTEDSTDEFPIVGDEDITNETNHDDSVLDETVWSDEFDVGSSQEFVEEAVPRSLFSRVLSILPGFRDSGRSFSHGMEIDDPQDVADESAGMDFPVPGPVGGAHANAQPRFIDVKAIDRGIRDKGGSAIDDTELAPPSQSSIAGPHAPGRAAGRGNRLEGTVSPSQNSVARPVPDTTQPRLEEFVFEKDDYLIVQSTGASKRSTWLETIMFPVIFVRNVFRGIGARRERMPVDEIEVASKRKLPGKRVPGFRRPVDTASADFDVDERSPEILPAGAESPTEPPDDFLISSDAAAKSAPRVTDPEKEGQPEKTADAAEDYAVATGPERRRTRFRPEFETSGESAVHTGDSSTEAGSAVASGPGDQQSATLSGRIENLLDYSGRDLNAIITVGPDSAGTPIEHDAQRQPAQSPSVSRVLVRIAAWFLTIPKRCLSCEGDLQDQNRLKIEPLIAAVPAIALAVSQIFSVSNFYARDKFESSNLFLKEAKANDAAGARETALISSMRSCSESITPENQYEYAFLKTRSTKPEDALLGLRLMRKLASPAGGNQPDAHLFIANEILRRSSSSRELRQSSFPYYLAELRAGFEASPHRYDLLEKLAEGLSERGEDQTLTNLITPYLDYWPLGHFFLAQAAFSRGDDILQKTHAFAVVRYFRGSPAELETNETSRIRFVISLAMAGEFGEAAETAARFFGAEAQLPVKESITERIKLIRLIARMSEFPQDSSRDVEAIGNELLAGELTPLYKSALKRQLLRKGPLRPALLDLCRKLYADRKETFDAEDYVFWASILRQNQQNAEAREFLENATEIDPKNDVAANNLANLLYKIEPYDLERALGLIQGVLDRNPDSPVYLETRGQILAKLGKCQEAIDDLGRCLVSFPDVAEIHETLATCYRKIGNDVLASAHQARFAELKSKATASPAKTTP